MTLYHCYFPDIDYFFVCVYVRQRPCFRKHILEYFGIKGYHVYNLLSKGSEKFTYTHTYIHIAKVFKC